MILDTSAIVAVLLAEPEREAFVETIGAAALVGIGAPTLVEVSIVAAARLRRPADEDVRRFLHRGAVEVVPFERAHWEAAADAWLRFGRGRHRAALNFGDCLAYATARVAGRPLLAKGDDFACTDLALVS